MGWKWSLKHQLTWWFLMEFISWFWSDFKNCCGTSLGFPRILRDLIGISWDLTGLLWELIGFYGKWGLQLGVQWGFNGASMGFNDLYKRQQRGFQWVQWRHQLYGNHSGNGGLYNLQHMGIWWDLIGIEWDWSNRNGKHGGILITFYREVMAHNHDKLLFNQPFRMGIQWSL